MRLPSVQTAFPQRGKAKLLLFFSLQREEALKQKTELSAELTKLRGELGKNPPRSSRRRFCRLVCRSGHLQTRLTLAPLQPSNLWPVSAPRLLNARQLRLRRPASVCRERRRRRASALRSPWGGSRSSTRRSCSSWRTGEAPPPPQVSLRFCLCCDCRSVCVSGWGPSTRRSGTNVCRSTRRRRTASAPARSSRSAHGTRART